MPLSILVPLDDSPSGDAAIQVALKWSKDAGGVLYGLGVVDQPAAFHREPMPIGASHYQAVAEERRLSDMKFAVEEALKQFGERCRREGVPHRILEDAGAPHDRILWHAQRCDVIHMGAHAHTFASPRQSSPLEWILRHSPRPVVAVPENLSSGGRGVVAAYDASSPAARALQSFACLYGRAFGTVHVLSVASEAGEASRRCDIAMDYLTLRGIPAVARPVAARGHVEEAVLEEVRAIGAEVVVMGAYGRPRLREFLMGSVTRAMLRRVPVPLFLHH